MTITKEALRLILPKICDKETTQAPTDWTPKNPLSGHCAVVSLVAQNLYGGDLLRASLEGTPCAAMRSHYWNKLPEGTEEDFTRPQFGDTPPHTLEAVVRTRAYVLSNEDTKQRYKRLSLRLAKHVQPQDTVDDKIYESCFNAALESNCKKLAFGCTVVRNEKIIYSSTNGTLEPLKHLCEPECIRNKIQSRTESMIGACAHAEEYSLWHLAKNNIPFEECDFYVAGIRKNGLPLPEDNTDFSCIRCATQLYNAGIHTISGPMNGKWIPLTAERALETAIAYALRQKTT